MKANELRIGNYINNEQRIDVISAIDEDNESIRCYWLKGKDRQSWTCLLGHIEPILLTEEWLKKFGFTQDTTNYTWDKLTGFDNVDYMFSIDTYPHKDGFYYHGIRIQYIHTLQNAFALTRNELEIKE